MKRCNECNTFYDDHTRYCVLCGKTLDTVDLPPDDTPTGKIARNIVKSKTLTSWLLTGKLEAVIKVVAAIISGILLFSGIGTIPLILLIIATVIFEKFRKH